MYQSGENCMLLETELIQNFNVFYETVRHEGADGV